MDKISKDRKEFTRKFQIDSHEIEDKVSLI